MGELIHKLLPTDKVSSLSGRLDECLGITPFYNSEKHQLVYEKEGSSILKLRLPLQYEWTSQQKIFENDERQYIILIVESGQAALAYGEGTHIIEHKVFKAYMVRKKQGKSQIKHLKTKGKSKAGSRVRLANTLHFFEEIQEKIFEWLSYFQVEYIALSCSKSLYSHLFTEDFGLDRNDDRIVKIPQHIQEANFENLLSIHSYLLKAELIFEETVTSQITDLLNSIYEDE